MRLLFPLFTTTQNLPFSIQWKRLFIFRKLCYNLNVNQLAEIWLFKYISAGETGSLHISIQPVGGTLFHSITFITEMPSKWLKDVLDEHRLTSLSKFQVRHRSPLRKISFMRRHFSIANTISNSHIHKMSLWKADASHKDKMTSPCWITRVVAMSGPCELYTSRPYGTITYENTSGGTLHSHQSGLTERALLCSSMLCI